MKDYFETITLFFKMIAFGAAAIMFAFLVFSPASIASQLEKMEQGLKETNHKMEISFFGTKIFKDGRIDRDLALAENRILELEEIVNCLTLGNDNCNETQLEQAKSIEQKLVQSSVVAPANVRPLPDVNTWMILTASFPELEQAQSFRERLVEYETDVIFAQNRYRPIAIFSSKKAAEEALLELQNVVGRENPYIRLLGAWCNTYERHNEGYISCMRE